MNDDEKDPTRFRPLLIIALIDLIIVFYFLYKMVNR